MRYKWILLMCVGVILVRATFANPVPSSPVAESDVEKHIEAFNSELPRNQTGNGTNLETKNESSITSNSTRGSKNMKNYSSHIRTSPIPTRTTTTTTEKPPNICTKSNLNYDCILQKVQLSRNESNDFGLTWKSNPQKNVTFESSRLAYLPKKLFEAFPQMEMLNAEDLQIEEIEPRAFSTAANLRWLYLKNNRLTTIDGFVGAQHLVHLDLSHNRIDSIDKDAFRNNKLLQTILLTDNYISELPNTNKNKNLQILDVSNNEISQIPDDTFSKNKELQSIDLSFNNLILFNLVQLENKPNLQKIDISHNKLESLYIPSQVKILSAANNSIASITLNECNVEKLDLSLNQIADVSALQKCTNMRILDLSHNRLQSFDLIRSFSNLARLYLAHNELFEIEFPSTKHSLQILDLSYNYLSFGPQNKFSNLKVIKLNNNKFIEFKFPKTNNLNYLLMSNNEWSCEKIMDINPKDVGDPVKDCGETLLPNGICCKNYMRPFNDRLKEIVQETYLHQNVNAKDLEKCKLTKPSSQKGDKPIDNKLLAKLDDERKKIVTEINTFTKNAEDIEAKITTTKLNTAMLNNNLKNFTSIVHKLRNWYGVPNEGLVSTKVMLNRVLKFTEDRKSLNENVLARREAEVQDTNKRLDDLKNNKKTVDAENNYFKNVLNDFKKKEAERKKEKQQLEKEANRNSPSLHGSKG